MAQFNLDVNHGIAGYRGQWNTAVVDLEEAAQWAKDIHEKQQHSGYLMDGMNAGGVHRALRDGDLKMAKQSEAFLEAFQDMTFNGRSSRTIAAVSGGAPNVAAHLAGTPMAMRRRERVIAPMGKLTVFIDGSGSAGNTTEDLTARGVALLGLVRMLTAVRPVEVYMACGGWFRDPSGGSYGNTMISGSVFVRLNAATMDLSRDGFAMAHPAFCRAFMFRACKDIPFRKRGATAPRDDGALGWELGGVEVYRHHGLSAFCNALGCDQSQSIFFTPMYLDDPAVVNPAQWIKDMMIKYGGQSAFDMDA